MTADEQEQKIVDSVNHLLTHMSLHRISLRFSESKMPIEQRIDMVLALLISRAIGLVTGIRQLLKAVREKDSDNWVIGADSVKRYNYGCPHHRRLAKMVGEDVAESGS